MSLNLDTRQRAMLAEMGVRVWWPQDTAAVPESQPLAPSDQVHDVIPLEAATAYSIRAKGQNVSETTQCLPAPPAPTPPTPHPHVEVAPPRRASPSPSTLAPLPSGIADMDWPDLHQAVFQCQACRMCLGRQQPVFAPPMPAQACDWLVVGDPPDDPQERAGQAFVDDAGQLLNQMLKAVGVARLPTYGLPDAVPGAAHQRAYLSTALKCRPALPTVPDAADLSACAHYLHREIALIKPKVILAMGRFALQLLLSADHPQGVKLPLGKLRGQLWHFAGVPVVVTYPPAYLLRNGADKARAWQDLCLAADVAEGLAPQV